MSILRHILLCLGITSATLANIDLKICDAKERLYHVVITDIYGEIICGGSLINDSWILTDSYCYKWGMKVVLGRHPGPARTVLIQDPPEIFVDPATGLRHIMLLKLPHPTKIENVKLPTCPHDLTNEVVRIAGYRLQTTEPNNQTDSRESNKLQCVKIKVSNCRKVNKKLIFYGCTDNRVDISWLDAGGAMIYDDMIYGVMIYQNQLSRNDPAPYLAVCNYLSWITRIITQ